MKTIFKFLGILTICFLSNSCDKTKDGNSPSPGVEKRRASARKIVERKSTLSEKSLRNRVESISKDIRHGALASTEANKLRLLLVEESENRGETITQLATKLLASTDREQDTLIVGKVLIEGFGDEPIVAISAIFEGSNGVPQLELVATALNKQVSKGRIDILEMAHNIAPEGPLRSLAAQKLVWGGLNAGGVSAAVDILKKLENTDEIHFTLMQFMPLIIRSDDFNLSKESLLEIKEIADRSNFKPYKDKLEQAIDLAE